jgi:UDP-glucose 4-epimerase
MNVAVTGANGFLGRHVVRALHARGHTVRALIRPAAAAGGLEGLEGVELVRADLRAPGGLEVQLDGSDAVVHLAAALSGDEDGQFATTVGGTERLLEAMGGAGIARLVLASSFAVYDWERIGNRLDEDSPVVEDVRSLDRRGGYTVSKVWQERVARRAAGRGAIALTVLRPGFVWAAGHEPMAGVGQSAGPLHLVIGPRRPLPLTYVENCADCFCRTVERSDAIGATLNVIDDDRVTAWRFMGEYVSRAHVAGRRVPMPYPAARAITELAGMASRRVFGAGGRLPSILTTAHFEARFKPLEFSTERLRTVLDWHAPLSFPAALERTYGPPANPSGEC